ncbi:MAG TPA: DUF1800 domain-containing protein [Steroidobacteraceae bacterium]|nr:DUF1800 domain-containing protein [Steroidobacteraceae bacterium]
MDSRRDIEAAVAANRYGLGARPGDLERIARAPQQWLAAQLTGGPPRLDDATLASSAAILAQSFDIRRQRRAAARATRAGTPPAQTAAGAKLAQLYRPIYIAEATARLRAAVATDRPFIERLTQFWTNHFAVSIDKFQVLGIAGSFEREAIRPHVLGSFSALTLAVEQHPAMLLYLDNETSIGPNSSFAVRVARRRPDARLGINENLAREIMELHTLGVNGGYTQADVTTFAKVLSGWSIGGGDGRLAGGEPGRFTFRPELHEPGAQRILGTRYAEEGLEQGVAVLRALSLHPATARHIAIKLARHFIRDDPPQAAADRLTHAFLASGGDLPTVYRALIHAPEPWREPLAKYKTPSDYVISSFRGLELPVEGRGALGGLEALGQRTYSPGSPAGWADRGSDWDGASALLKRIEWAAALGQRLAARFDARELAPELLGGTLGTSTRTAIAHAATGGQALALLLASPEFLRR